MKRFYTTFYAKLSAVFLVLLLIMGLVQVVITLRSSSRFFSEADQKLNLRLAGDMAAEFAPILRDSLDLAALEHQIHYMMVMNPKIEIYLLDDSGRIMAYFMGPNKKLTQEQVALAPVHTFLTHAQDRLILGDDPRNPGRQKPFSAARIRIGKAIDGYLYIVTESEQFDSAADLIRESYLVRNLTTGVLVTLFFTGVLGLVLFAVLTRRVTRITEVVKAFERGDLKQRIPARTRDEIDDLARSFNNMADTIVANMEELQKTDKLRRELTANVSHDLRSPLASIKGYLETIQIKDSSLTHVERRRYIDTILNITATLERLVEDLFELSKLDARQSPPLFEPFSIVDLVQDVVMKFKPVADKAGIAILPEVPEKLPMVYADIGLIERALSNLIENALRYMKKDGVAKIIVRDDGDKISMLVSDTGCGIAEEELPYIFDRFYRVEKSRARETGGSGLGLAIAKRIVELHQSRIYVQSRVDVGTTFSFRLEPWNASLST